MQPLLIVIVFGALLPKMGFMRAGYQSALLPGILAMLITLLGATSFSALGTDGDHCLFLDDRAAKLLQARDESRLFRDR